VSRPGLPARVAALTLAAVIAVTTVAACGAPAASVAPATPVPSGVVAIDAAEYKFTPSTVTVPPGLVTISVKNAGKEPHEFEILQGETPLAPKVEAFGVGLTRDLQVTLAAGSYTLICRLNGHDQLGMKGTLTVQ
jgi:plastocyanin